MDLSLGKGGSADINKTIRRTEGRVGSYRIKQLRSFMSVVSSGQV